VHVFNHRIHSLRVSASSASASLPKHPLPRDPGGPPLQLLQPVMLSNEGSAPATSGPAAVRARSLLSGFPPDTAGLRLQHRQIRLPPHSAPRTPPPIQTFPPLWRIAMRPYVLKKRFDHVVLPIPGSPVTKDELRSPVNAFSKQVWRCASSVHDTRRVVSWKSFASASSY